ncbi:3-deoxy-D-manno-octulosonate 8-phosphate phosphatase [Candidatus Legionella polyplacis]|uniref:KdsC family phosphatase n=1 Tax=Candidatus Legionella polyplacis TaxID=2005262 RepID=UPI000C1EE501|nr:HAD-IIIA family hydrolase [Candidatus Legionella polyplacis]ATW01688.1 3-deoxy-D-manno-octulosonate 8-phosphate phosphatase [Candidatus Legionella polyplacis]
MKKTILDKAKKIKCLICDVDGVLTNGFFYIDNHGNEFKSFYVHDGIGIKLLIMAGIEVAIITISNSKIIDFRVRQLGIKYFFKGQTDKNHAFNKLKTILNLKNEEFAYIGDDIPDISVMKQVGLSISVSNATEQAKKNSIWQTKRAGGYGAVREVCELILNSQNKKNSINQIL